MNTYFYPLGVALFTGACYFIGNSRGKRQIGNKQVTITEAQDGSVVETAVNTELKVVLKEYSCAGYLWELACDADHVIAQSHQPEYISTRPANTDMVGGSGAVMWSFKTCQPGVSVLKLRLRRPWMNIGADPLEKIFTCEIVVK